MTAAGDACVSRRKAVAGDNSGQASYAPGLMTYRSSTTTQGAATWPAPALSGAPPA